MTKRLLFLSFLFANFPSNSNAGWLDFMGKAVSSVGNAAKSVGGAVGNVAKSVGSSVAGRAKCNMMKNQGMMNTPDYYQECIQTGLAGPSMGGMGGMPVGLPYGVTPSVGGGMGGVNTTLNDQWSDDPLAGAGSQFMQPGMGGGMMGQPGMMGGGMGQMQGQSSGFSGMLGRGLASSMMGGQRGMPPGGGYGGQPGYGQPPGYGARPY